MSIIQVSFAPATLLYNLMYLTDLKSSHFASSFSKVTFEAPTQHYELKVSVQTLYIPQHNRNTDQYGSRHLSHVANDDLAVNNY